MARFPSGKLPERIRLAARKIDQLAGRTPIDPGNRLSIKGVQTAIKSTKDRLVGLGDRLEAAMASAERADKDPIDAAIRKARLTHTQEQIVRTFRRHGWKGDNQLDDESITKLSDELLDLATDPHTVRTQINKRFEETDVPLRLPSFRKTLSDPRRALLEVMEKAVKTGRAPSRDALSEAAGYKVAESGPRRHTVVNSVITKLVNEGNETAIAYQKKFGGQGAKVNRKDGKTIQKRFIDFYGDPNIPIEDKPAFKHWFEQEGASTATSLTDLVNRWKRSTDPEDQRKLKYFLEKVRSAIHERHRKNRRTKRQFGGRYLDNDT